MKLLFDQNIARKAVSLLASEFPGSVHVSSVGLDTATDRGIWTFAAQNGFAIVSKDADFHHMSFLYGPPPKTVWVRIGNCSTVELISFMKERSATIRAFLSGEQNALLVLDRHQ